MQLTNCYPDFFPPAKNILTEQHCIGFVCIQAK